MVKSLEERTEKLLSKAECMVLLCSKASSYWSMIKFVFNIPLVLTSSAMCIMRISIPLDLSSRPFIPLPRFKRSRRVAPLLAPSLGFTPRGFA